MKEKLTNKQYATWNKLRFGNQHPTLIRKEFAKLLKDSCSTYEIDVDNCIDVHIICPTDTKNLWFKYDHKDDIAFFQMKYWKYVKSFIIVNQEDSDLDVHIGWDNEQNLPAMTLENRHHSNDIITYSYTCGTDNAKQIAKHWLNVLTNTVDWYKHAKRQTNYLTKHLV